MEKSQAIKLIEDIFDNSFSEEKFLLFCKNLLNDINVSKADKHPRVGQYVFEPYRNHVKSFRRIGQYTDPKGEVIDILSVKVHDGFKIERTRTGLRNFAIEYLKRKEDRDTLLVAFHSDESTEWRFSFIKLEYKTVKDEKGRIKARQEATSAKRYSFLVGEHEPCHTAKRQLLPLLLDTTNNPSIYEIEQCFNIERVTKEFFDQYKTLFVSLQEHLDTIVEKDKKIANDFKEKKIETTAFAKKLLGQIVFLYFIQKKGWLGVPKDKGFGQGEKRFLKNLFDKAAKKGENFFNKYLEPLFYEALAVQRVSAGDASYYKRFDCKIPFLNGGLFEPIKDYDWQNTDINIPNEVFSNTTVTKEGDSGTGILDVFDRYNFTVKEDEPLEKEVAVDPEMLGKVFENLLEVKDRKSKGAFYTPREIVHYMCEESLVNYLDTALNSKTASYQELGTGQTDLLGNPSRDQLTLEVEHKDVKIPKDDIYAFIKNSHLVIEDNRKEKSSFTWKLPQSIQIHAALFDKALAEIKVCDPAIGSGAFPVGMLTEIVKARTALTPYIKTKDDSDERTPYHLKRECIQNSLYGVDIEESAIDIAKLRLWLSLVVDEDDIQSIEPLPNLDYKIVCGDSLIGVNTLDVFIQPALEKIESLKIKYFSETDRKKKEELRDQISLLFQTTMKNAHLSPNTFEFKFHFSEVWHGRGGFDVVIGNPPYIQLQKFRGNPLQQLYKNQNYSSYDANGDIYCLFYEKGLQTLKENGNLCFITSNKWMRTGYGEKLRSFFIRYNPIALIDLGPDIFDTATVDTNVLLIKKSTNEQILKAVVLSKVYKNRNQDITSFFSDNSVLLNGVSASAWFIGSDKELKIKEKIEQNSIPLKDCKVNIFFGIKTGLNEAFIIDNDTKERLCKEDSNSAKILKPILRGRDIVRYGYKWAGLWLVSTGFDVDIRKSYKAVYKHLQQFEEDAIKRDDQGQNWWNLRACAYYNEFEQKKIVWKRIGSILRFCIDKNGTYCQDSTCIMTGERLNFLCAVMNSKIGHKQLFDKAPKTGTGDLIVSVQALEPLLIPKITNENKSEITKIEKLVDQISDKYSTVLDSEIDARVAYLYNLTESEYQLILEGTEDTFRITALNFFRDIEKGILK